MNSFANADDMWVAMIDDCLRSDDSVESREGGSSEVIGWSGRLESIRFSLVTNPERKLSARYAGAEVLWYLSLTSDIRMILPHAPSYGKLWADPVPSVAPAEEMYGAVGGRLRTNPGFIKARDHVGYEFRRLKFAMSRKCKCGHGKNNHECPSGVCCSADKNASCHCTEFVSESSVERSRLGKILENENQLDMAAALLREHPNTRRCVISLWDSGDLVHGLLGVKKNVPCYIAFQFLLRGGRLHMITTMRSNDVWLGAPYDIFAFTMIQQFLAESLGVEPGSYTHNVGSLHVYDKHRKRALKALKAYDQIGGMIPLQQDGWGLPSVEAGKKPSTSLVLQDALMMDKRARDGWFAMTEFERKGHIFPAGHPSARTPTDECRDIMVMREGGGSMIHDMLLCAMHRHFPDLGLQEVVANEALMETLIRELARAK